MSQPSIPLENTCQLSVSILGLGGKTLSQHEQEGGQPPLAPALSKCARCLSSTPTVVFFLIFWPLLFFFSEPLCSMVLSIQRLRVERKAAGTVLSPTAAACSLPLSWSLVPRAFGGYPCSLISWGFAAHGLPAWGSLCVRLALLVRSHTPRRRCTRSEACGSRLDEVVHR